MLSFFFDGSSVGRWHRLLDSAARYKAPGGRGPAVPIRAADSARTGFSFLLSFFDGIGGMRRALDLLGCAPAVFACSETDSAAIRVVEGQWPGAIQLGPVETIDETEVWRYLSLKHPLVYLWLAGGGFPC